MEIKKIIKSKSLLLFNKLGVINVTLREIAKQINKSYGNVTYHYASKEELLFSLFEDMNEELSALHLSVETNGSLIQYFFKLPEYNFDISVKYLFFSKDFVEIKRHYPTIFNKAHQLNLKRKSKWMILFIKLKEDGYLNKHLEQKDLDYIILLSTSVRTYYFQSLEYKEYHKESFTDFVNQLLKPYLSAKGLKEYAKFLANR